MSGLDQSLSLSALRTGTPQKRHPDVFNMSLMKTPSMSYATPTRVGSENARQPNKSVHFAMKSSLNERLAAVASRVSQDFSTRVAKADMAMSQYSFRSPNERLPDDIEKELKSQNERKRERRPPSPDPYCERKIKHLAEFIRKKGPLVGVDPDKILDRKSETDIITQFAMTRTLGSYETRAIQTTVKESLMQTRAGTLRYTHTKRETPSTLVYRLKGEGGPPVREDASKLSVFHPMFSGVRG
ncbi:hypothetical protein J8273_8097 [Carpediemonas membranifera]|uniref:Uncharacterized protein n=1 Tax=Carpediemonas membranifera TaxID=201153 RepID=A0A8J6AS31_9EUKA|nr:hypothetical protein J8273_8097 [Carpediemonas membranifera]|eukprot:KAG9390060.1 hypothetical protein J8273_8097 [Carpediemonas membranifera]